jgi:hypothetical protein
MGTYAIAMTGDDDPGSVRNSRLDLALIVDIAIAMKYSLTPRA